MTEEKNENTTFEGSAFGRVLARIMRSRGMAVDAETVEWLADGAGLVPEDLMARMAGETMEHVGSMEWLVGALKLDEREMGDLALAYTLESESSEEQGTRSRMGSTTDNPCWREAVSPRFADEDEPCLCAEHARVVEANDDMEGRYRNLVKIDAWIKGPVAKQGDEDLTRLAYNVRDKARREYGALVVRERAARMVADRLQRSPVGTSLSLEQEEELARLMVREEALNNARTIFEDADEEDLELRDKWATIDALALAADDAHEEFMRLCEELGFSG